MTDLKEGDVVRIRGMHLRHDDKATILRLNYPDPGWAEVRILGHDPEPRVAYPAYPLTDLVLAPSYPEHERLREVKAQSQAIGEFLGWVIEQGFWLYSDAIEGRSHLTVEEWLALYFEIDLNKIAAEKDAMLEEQRRLNDC